MSPVTWRLIRSEALSAAMNMALDEALLESVAAGRSLPVLRLYRWQPAAISLGYGQRGARVVNLSACRELGFDVVRRMTGGRAVLHDREVTYAVAAREGQAPLTGKVLDTYRIIAGVLAEVVGSFGLAATLARERQAGGSGEGAQRSACFTASSHYELLVDGCKVAGSAQRRQAGAFLQHGSIPLELDPALLFRALDTRCELSAEAGGARLATRVGWLNRWRSAPLGVEEVEERLIDVFARRFDVEWRPLPPSAVEWGRAEELAAHKYANPAWNLQGLGGPEDDR